MSANFKILLVIILACSSLNAQIPIKFENIEDIPEIKDGFIVRGLVVDGDTVPHVIFKEIIVLPPFVFKSRRQAVRYNRLVRYVKKVYPYSQIVKKTIYEAEAHLSTIDNNRDRRKYIKEKEKEMKDQFEGDVRNMTVTQGIILIKLIDRETGDTTYELIKELKGSINAFFWQSIARLFGSNLKLEYDAAGDDRMIEDIVVRIENGLL
jgi:hypothetical protein